MAILAAVFATPVVIAASFTLLSLWQLLTTGSWSPWLVFNAWLLLSAFATPATLVMVVIAAPLVRRLRRGGRANLPSLIRLGMLLAVLPFVVFDVYVVATQLVTNPPEAASTLIDDLPVALKWAALASACGAGSAVAYWMAARDR